MLEVHDLFLALLLLLKLSVCTDTNRRVGHSTHCTQLRKSETTCTCNGRVLVSLKHRDYWTLKIGMIENSYLASHFVFVDLFSKCFSVCNIKNLGTRRYCSFYLLCRACRFPWSLLCSEPWGTYTPTGRLHRWSMACLVVSCAVCRSARGREPRSRTASRPRQETCHTLEMEPTCTTH